MIYDTGLTNDEAVLLSKSMMKKYQIAAGQQPEKKHADSERVSEVTTEREF